MFEMNQKKEKDIEEVDAEFHTYSDGEKLIDEEKNSW